MMELKRSLNQQHIAMSVKRIMRYHCHFTGQFRGAAHQQCNFNYKIDKKKCKLPIVFHNLRGDDAHLICQKIKRKHGQVIVIPNNSERYISFDVGRLKFLDSVSIVWVG